MTTPTLTTPEESAFAHIAHWLETMYAELERIDDVRENACRVMLSTTGEYYPDDLPLGNELAEVKDQITAINAALIVAETMPS
jgi:hypothetical protein